MAGLFKVLFGKLGKSGDGKKPVAQRLQENFPHVQPKRWFGYEGIHRDGKMLARLFTESIDYFRSDSKRSAEFKPYKSKDDYLRQENLSPLQLKKQLRRFSIYSLICYALSLAIFVYMFYIFAHVSIADGIICLLFALFVLVKGLQFSLFIRQVKSGNFKKGLKDLFSK